MPVDRQRFISWVGEYTNYFELSQRATDAFSGWQAKDPNVLFTKMREVLDVAEEVISLVEKFTKDVDDLSSKHKLELAVDFLDDLTKFPFYIEWVDGMIIKYVLATLVEYKNKHLGKDWYVEENGDG